MLDDGALPHSPNHEDTTMAKFPKTIQVTRESDGDVQYLSIAEGGIDAITEPKDVAIYQLVEVGRVEITKTFTKK
jgi:hypothetical protein